MLELIDITRKFPQRGMVLDGLNLLLAEGEAIAITGPSGSGKSTLLNIIGLLDKADSGSVIFRGNDISSLSPEESARYRRENLGFIFQDHHLLPHLTIYENILLPFLATGRKAELDDVRVKYIDSLLKQTGIESIRNNYPQLVSGGEAQRATIVRALVNRPALLLADEPTGSLDSENAELLGKLLMDVNSTTGTTVIAVTHSENLAAIFPKRVKLLDGKLHKA